MCLQKKETELGERKAEIDRLTEETVKLQSAISEANSQFFDELRRETIKGEAQVKDAQSRAAADLQEAMRKAEFRIKVRFVHIRA